MKKLTKFLAITSISAVAAFAGDNGLNMNQENDAFVRNFVRLVQNNTIDENNAIEYLQSVLTENLSAKRHDQALGFVRLVQNNTIDENNAVEFVQHILEAESAQELRNIQQVENVNLPEDLRIVDALNVAEERELDEVLNAVDNVDLGEKLSLEEAVNLINALQLSEKEAEVQEIASIQNHVETITSAEAISKVMEILDLGAEDKDDILKQMSVSEMQNYFNDNNYAYLIEDKDSAN